MLVTLSWTVYFETIYLLQKLPVFFHFSITAISCFFGRDLKTHSETKAGGVLCCYNMMYFYVTVKDIFFLRQITHLYQVVQEMRIVLCIVKTNWFGLAKLWEDGNVQTTFN